MCAWKASNESNSAAQVRQRLRPPRRMVQCWAQMYAIVCVTENDRGGGNTKPAPWRSVSPEVTPESPTGVGARGARPTDPRMVRGTHGMT